jgi:nucleotide-binding universal stress UspA family protein
VLPHLLPPRFTTTNIMSKRVSSSSRTVLLHRVFRKILLAVDGPENSGRATELAIRLAALNGAELEIVHVLTSGPPILPTNEFGAPNLVLGYYFDAQQRSARQHSRWLARLVGAAEEQGVRASMRVVLTEKTIAEEVAERATEDEADLVVVGTKERSSLDRLISGSVSSGVVRKAKCPVLVVR